MTLNIAILGENNDKVIEQLSNYYKENNYKTSTIQDTHKIEIEYILNKYNLTIPEKALLQAFTNSFNYNPKEYEKYDIIFWNKTQITDYLKNKKNLTLRYIQQINRYSPKMDYTILITDHDYPEIRKNYKNTTIIPNKTMEDMIKEINMILNGNLPKCKYCGHIFKRTQKHKKYCTTKCSEKAFNDQCRENNREYYKRYKNVLTEKQKGQLGSKNANLHAKSPNLKEDKPNFFKELETVRNAKKALGLRK